MSAVSISVSVKPLASASIAFVQPATTVERAWSDSGAALRRTIGRLLSTVGPVVGRKLTSFRMLK